MPEARRVFILASCFLATLIGTKSVLADPILNRRVLQIEHVKIDSTKSFAAAKAAFEGAVPQLDPSIAEALTEGEEKRAETLAGRADLFLFLKRDHGALLKITGEPRNAVQYEIGNPFTATKMTRRQLPAALYAPLRVVLYENAAGGATFEYDQPSSLFGQFGDERVAEVGRDLDAELERALLRALQ
jgi:hypothetical protein